MPREVKRILNQIAREKKQLFCKGIRDVFFGFKPTEYRDNAGMLGRIVVFYAKPKRFEKVMVNFVIGTNRFFALAKFGSEENRGLLKFEPVFYRLERRLHLRIPLTSGVKKICNVIQWSDKVVFLQAIITDISLGGVQISLPAQNYRPSRQGTPLKIVLHIKSKWNIEVLTEIRRIELGSDQVLLGLKFKSQDLRTQRQIQALATELQREFIRKDIYVES